MEGSVALDIINYVLNLTSRHLSLGCLQIYVLIMSFCSTRLFCFLVSVFSLGFPDGCVLPVFFWAAQLVCSQSRFVVLEVEI